MFSDFARSRGKKIEPRIYQLQGGKPSLTMMRRADRSLDTHSKDRYRAFLASKLTRTASTAAEEEQNQAVADAFYEQAGTWLRENTRDTKKFSILFNENISYGYRRNLLGLKWVALGLNLAVVAICAGLLRYNAPINIADAFTGRVLVVLVVAAIHAVYIVAVVNQHGVIAAAGTYARQLILSTETFLAAGKKPKAAKKAR
jgi:membrane protein YqaA with SNARE-associated domain